MEKPIPPDNETDFISVSIPGTQDLISTIVNKWKEEDTEIIEAHNILREKENELFETQIRNLTEAHNLTLSNIEISEQTSLKNVLEGRFEKIKTLVHDDTWISWLWKKFSKS